MKKSINNSEREEEVAKKAVNPIEDENKDIIPDEMSDIRKFIQKRRLENKILKKLTDELQSSSGSKIDQSKSA